MSLGSRSAENHLGELVDSIMGCIYRSKASRILGGGDYPLLFARPHLDTVLSFGTVTI